jgi:hypothetical protein
MEACNRFTWISERIVRGVVRNLTARLLRIVRPEAGPMGRRYRDPIPSVAHFFLPTDASKFPIELPHVPADVRTHAWTLVDSYVHVRVTWRGKDDLIHPSIWSPEDVRDLILLTYEIVLPSHARSIFDSCPPKCLWSQINENYYSTTSIAPSVSRFGKASWNEHSDTYVL